MLTQELLSGFYCCYYQWMFFIIESKGEQLKNDDTIAQIHLGCSWNRATGPQYKYLMVFSTSTRSTSMEHATSTISAGY